LIAFRLAAGDAIAGVIFGGCELNPAPRGVVILGPLWRTKNLVVG